MLIGILAIVFCVIADQFSKFLIDTVWIIDSPIEVSDFFNIVKVWNKGVSFSMFNGYGEIGTVMLIVFALSVVAYLFKWMHKEFYKPKIVALGLIIGGALGNVIDRIRVGAVLDFLDFHYGMYHWPAFNMADTFICIGACILIYMEIRHRGEKGLNEV